MNTLRSGFAVLVLATAAFVFADDGWMPLNGAAASMGHKHPTVQMVSEIVRATVGKDASNVTCDFVFKNHGPACSVRMGFPAGGENDDELETKDMDQHILKHFKSFVEGKPVATKHVVLGHDAKLTDYFGITQWEVKTVNFKKNQTLHIRDTYVAPNGVTNLSSDTVSHFYYILATGGSWRGDIERADVVITVSPNLVPKSPKFSSGNMLTAGETASGAIGEALKKDPNTVYYEGPGTVSTDGRTLTFTKKNWTPKDEDNITLTFGLKPIKA